MYALFKKDIKLFFKDKRSVILSFLLPIILISLFAFAFGGIGKRDTAKALDLLLVDKDNTSSSQALIKAIQSIEGVHIIPMQNQEAEKAITTGKQSAALLIHNGFSRTETKTDKLELRYDKSQEIKIALLQSVLIKAIMEHLEKSEVSQNIQSILNTSFPDLTPQQRKEIMEKIKKDNSTYQKTATTFNHSIKMTSIVGKDKETNLGLIQAVAGTSILMLLFSIAGLGTGLLEEKENATLHRLLISPVKNSHILYAKMLFAFCMASLQLSVMFLFAYWAFGLDIFNNLLSLVLMIMATAFAVSGFGIFLAAVSKTRQQAQSLGTLIILVMSAIGGSMIPLFIMPEFMQKMAVFSVNYWGIQGFYDIFWRQLPTAAILPRIGVLLGIGVLMTLLSIKLFKKNILKLI